MLHPNQQRGSLDLEVVEACPLCRRKRLRQRFNVSHITGDPLHSWASDQGFSNVDVLACRDCGFLLKQLRPSSSYLHQHYVHSGEAYVERVAEEDSVIRQDYRVARRFLNRTFPQGAAILDVGCASGFFLDSLGSTWKKHGLEILHVAAERARRRPGICVHECDIESAKFADKSFDAASAFDVLEHLADPTPFFAEVERILKPAGHLILGTGNSQSISALMSGSRWTYLCIPEHVSFFSPRSLRVALQRAGFSHIEFKRIHHGERSAAVATGWFRAVGKHWAVSVCGDSITRFRLFRHKTTDFQVPYFLDHMICIAQGK